MKTSPQTTDDAALPLASAPAPAPAPTVADAGFGAHPGWVWELPAGPRSARHARTVLTETLTALTVPDGTLDDAVLMISELATNAHRHATADGPHELWVDVVPAHGGAAGERELRCAVYDRAVDRMPGTAVSGDHGRGLGIVAGLAASRWGARPALSRLGAPVRGKAVWFALPIQGAYGAA